MAKQRGIIKLHGTIGDITFVKTQDGYLAKEKTSVNGSRIATDKAFARTRENASEFGRAGKAGKLLRSAIRPVLQEAKDRRVTSRLTKEMMKVIKADTISSRGLRNAVDGKTELLQNFEFNGNAAITTTFFAGYTASIDRPGGKLDIIMQDFVPLKDIVAPEGATHFKIVTAGTEIDFEKETFFTSENSTATLPWDNNTVPAATLSNPVTANSTHPLFLLMGIQFYQEVNGSFYSLKNGAYNTLSIVKVSAT